MRCVLITPLGSPVEPDVNKILAMVSGVMAWNARSTASSSGADSSESKARAPSGTRTALPDVDEPWAESADDEPEFDEGCRYQ
jgi:hypothetical protein